MTTEEQTTVEEQELLDVSSDGTPSHESEPTDAELGLRKEISKLRASNRELKSQVAEYQFASQPPAQSEPESPPESPYDKWKASEDYDPESPVPASVYEAQRAFERQQAESQSQRATAQQMEAAKAKSLAVAKATYTAEEMGEGRDFTTVVTEGARYLTPQQKMLINQGGEFAGKMAYDWCLEAGIKAGVISEKKRRAAPKPQPTEAADKTTTEKPAAKPDEPVPAAPDVLGRRLRPRASRLGFFKDD